MSLPSGCVGGMVCVCEFAVPYVVICGAGRVLGYFCAFTFVVAGFDCLVRIWCLGVWVL